jgi:hypothetical protein
VKEKVAKARHKPTFWLAFQLAMTFCAELSDPAYSMELYPL